ncbi:MAG: hypothetical protein UW24_C0011G0016 [Parcubacteria group bacterium GW2011_GWA2_44_12]|nr:MAG: hypothetical protein UW24_C0011G0016 [Parcubacteria group bacterium GW2011_GWA2_44_12]
MFSLVKQFFHSKNKLHDASMLASRREIISGLLWLLVFAGIMFAGAKFIGIAAIQEKVASAGIFAPLVMILAKASTIVFAPLGGGPLYIIAGPLFGFTKGFLYVFLGDILGSFIAFYISKFFGRKVMRKFLSDAGMKYVDDILYHLATWKGLVYARVILSGIPEVVSYAAGLSKLPFWLFGLITGIVYLVVDSVFVVLGQTIFQNPILGAGAFSIGTLVVVIVGLFFIRKRKRG